MSTLFATFAAVSAAALLWLVATRKITFPVLFDAGLTTMALGAVVMADGLAFGEIRPAALWMLSAGAILLLLSYARQVRKYNRKHRYGEPKEIDGRNFGRITGGKDS
jgi:hypothetical protein